MTVSGNINSNYCMYTVLVAILYALLFYYGLGRLGLMDNNEGLYAEIPREMLVTGDFIIPHLNGVPYIEKPPLLYWMTAASYLVFGFNEFAARFIPATSGLLTGLLLMHFLIIKARPSQAILTGLIWVTSLGVTIFARVIFFDMLMTFMLTWAMTSFFLWFDKRRKKYLYNAYIAMALGILTKGLLAFILPTGIAILFLVLSFDSNTSHSADRWSYLKSEAKLTLDPLCIGVFLIIVLPWHLIAFYRDNNFLWFYFVNEHILRFIGHRVPHDYYRGPPYFYVTRLLAYLLPWTLFLLVFIWPRSSMDILENQTIDRRLKIFLWVWFAVFMSFFTISEAKANYYIVTAFPPVFMLVADGILARARLFRAYIFPAIFSFQVIFLIATIWILTAGVVPVLHPYKDMIPRWLMWPISISGLTATCCAWGYRRRTSFFAAAVGIAIMYASLIVTFVSVLPVFEKEISTKQILLDIRNQAPSSPLYLFRRFEGYLASAVFYNKEPIPIIDSCSNDLLYGQTLGTFGHIFSNSRDVDKQINFNEAFVLVVKKDQENFLDSFGQRYILWRDYGRVQVYTTPHSLLSIEDDD